MLPSVDSLKASILALKPSMSQAEGVANFVGVVADFVNQVQAGSTGSPGIFALNKPAMISLLVTQSPVKDSSWIDNFVAAFQAGCMAAVITPGTVSSPTWIGSGSKDLMTVPSASSTIPTLSVAMSTLKSGLANAKPDSSAPLPIAQAINDAVLQFQFTCIGLGPPPALSPIPMIFTAK